jgi:predicted ATP-dependent endonuclease of OLD family
MKITSFSVKGLHGYLDQSVKFQSDLTFLTGINGSGKTSVVRGVVALLLPSFRYLAETEFSRMRLDFEQDGKRHFIVAERDENAVRLRRSGNKTWLELFVPSHIDLGFHRETPGYRERLYEMIDRELVTHADHPVLKFIQSLPTPMFLGLERSVRADEEESVRSSRRFRYRDREAISGTLQGVLEAQSVAERHHRDRAVEHYRIAETLRKKLILSSFDAATEGGGSMRLSLPPKGFETELIKNKQMVVRAIQNIGIYDDPAASAIENFFESLLDAARNLTGYSSVEEALNETESSGHLFRWMSLQPQLERIDRMQKHIETYNSRRERIFGPINRYINAINKFISDGGKNLSFNTRGQIIVKRGNKDITVERLSSGEAHIIAIMTHLCFAPSRDGAKVLIIDEPELSLHIRWQEIFVDTINDLNKNVQVVLATHSPSIIMDKTSHCVSL